MATTMVMTPTPPIPAAPRPPPSPTITSATATTAPNTPIVGGWHFPGSGTSPAVPLSISPSGFQRNYRRLSTSAAPSSSKAQSEFKGVASRQPSRHSFGGFQHNTSGVPLPYCSPTCRDCPTSSRLLLVLHSMKEGSPTPDGWTQRPASERVPNERTRWSRISSSGGRRARAATAAAAVSSEKVNRSSSASTSEPMVPPFNVLITGSTKGIGYALAKQFLREGDNVIVCSRSEERVQKALKELRREFGEDQVLGTTCDVRNINSVQALAQFAKMKLGYVDIWINNAGTNAYSYKTLVDTNDAAIEEIVTTNTLGVMLCCREAIRTMRDQPRGGHIFNMDGAGADGNPTPRFAVYGATKRSLAQFTKSLQAELKQLSIKNVGIHDLSPGMVTTDLLMSGSDTRQAKFFINVLAEPADEVASYLVPRIRAVPGDKNKSSKYIRFLTGFKAYTQILARLIFKARKDRFVPED
ncbi:unnamed protein product [Calypogeia fissa]